MERLIQKADVLIEALPYIQQFRNAIVVVKFGGSAMEVQKNMQSILADVAFMECAGMRPVIVHGGGKAISRGMERDGIDSRFLHGLRVTCERSIGVVERVIKEEVNPRVVRMLQDWGALAESLHGDRIFHVARKRGNDPDTGEPLDWGFVGDPGDVDVAPVMELLDAGKVPVITPLGVDAEGQLHNINADVAAAALAKALKARKLAFVSDVPGLLRDPESPVTIIPSLRTGEIGELIEEGVISGGMLPKVESAIEAIEAGVGKVHMIDGRLAHALLLEIFTEKGVGTEIIADE